MPPHRPGRPVTVLSLSLAVCLAAAVACLSTAAAAASVLTPFSVADVVSFPHNFGTSVPTLDDNWSLDLLPLGTGTMIGVLDEEGTSTERDTVLVFHSNGGSPTEILADYDSCKNVVQASATSVLIGACNLDLMTFDVFVVAVPPDADSGGGAALPCLSTVLVLSVPLYISPNRIYLGLEEVIPFGDHIAFTVSYSPSTSLDLAELSGVYVTDGVTPNGARLVVPAPFQQYSEVVAVDVDADVFYVAYLNVTAGPVKYVDVAGVFNVSSPSPTVALVARLPTSGCGYTCSVSYMSYWGVARGGRLWLWFDPNYLSSTQESFIYYWDGDLTRIGSEVARVDNYRFTVLHDDAAEDVLVVRLVDLDANLGLGSIVAVRGIATGTASFSVLLNFLSSWDVTSWAVSGHQLWFAIAEQSLWVLDMATDAAARMVRTALSGVAVEWVNTETDTLFYRWFNENTGISSLVAVPGAATSAAVNEIQVAVQTGVDTGVVFQFGSGSLSSFSLMGSGANATTLFLYHLREDDAHTAIDQFQFWCIKADGAGGVQPAASVAPSIYGLYRPVSFKFNPGPGRECVMFGVDDRGPYNSTLISMCADEGETPAYFPLVTDEFGYYKYPGSFYAIPQFSYFDVVGAHLATFTWWTPLGNTVYLTDGSQAYELTPRRWISRAASFGVPGNDVIVIARSDGPLADLRFDLLQDTNFVPPPLDTAVVEVTVCDGAYSLSSGTWEFDIPANETRRIECEHTDIRGGTLTLYDATGGMIFALEGSEACDAVLPPPSAQLVWSAESVGSVPLSAGFRLRTTALPVEPFCAPFFASAAASGHMYSGLASLGGLGYVNLAACVWNISGVANETIAVEAHAFDLGPGDVVSFYDGPDAGSPLLARFTGDDWLSDVVSSGPALTAFFASDGSGVGGGFDLEWSRVATGGYLCDTRRRETARIGTFAPVPGLATRHCAVELSVPTDATMLVVTVDDFVPALDAAADAVVAFYDGPTIETAGFLGALQPDMTANVTFALSVTPNATVLVTTSGPGGGGPLAALALSWEFPPASVAACGGSVVLTNATGSGSSVDPFGDAPYAPGVDCWWVIASGGGSDALVMVEVSDLDLRSTDADVLSIVAGADPADDSALMARIDGTGAGDALVATAAFVSPGPDLSLRFQSGTVGSRVVEPGLGTGLGVRFNYTLLDGLSLADVGSCAPSTQVGVSFSGGAVRFPNHFGAGVMAPYAPSQACLWNLTSAGSVEFTVTALSLGAGDALVIEDPLAGVELSWEPHVPSSSLSSQLIIRFTSDGVNDYATGFAVDFVQVPAVAYCSSNRCLPGSCVGFETCTCPPGYLGPSCLACNADLGYSGYPDCSLCGNEVVEPPEVCDTGGNTAACDADCTAPACGDGVFNPFAEECDGVNCTAACLRCGNGLLDPGEACDYAMAGETECTTACAIATDPPEDVGNDGNGDAVENATGADDDGGLPVWFIVVGVLSFVVLAASAGWVVIMYSGICRSLDSSAGVTGGGGSSSAGGGQAATASDKNSFAGLTVTAGAEKNNFSGVTVVRSGSERKASTAADLPSYELHNMYKEVRL